MQKVNYFDINDNVNSACFSVPPLRKKEFSHCIGNKFLKPCTVVAVALTWFHLETNFFEPCQQMDIITSIFRMQKPVTHVNLIER